MQRQLDKFGKLHDQLAQTHAEAQTVQSQLELAHERAQERADAEPNLIVWEWQFLAPYRSMPGRVRRTGHGTSEVRGLILNLSTSCSNVLVSQCRVVQGTSVVGAVLAVTMTFVFLGGAGAAWRRKRHPSRKPRPWTRCEMVGASATTQVSAITLLASAALLTSMSGPDGCSFAEGGGRVSRRPSFAVSWICAVLVQLVATHSTWQTVRGGFADAAVG